MSLSSGDRSESGGRDRALRILARSIVRELEVRGYAHRHIVALASELISLACDAMRTRRASTPEP
jgi:hypothetical protein